MFDSITYFRGKDVKRNLTTSEEEYTEGNIAEWPSIFKSIKNKRDLKNDIYDKEDTREKV
jgi:hypothetical protein